MLSWLRKRWAWVFFSCMATGLLGYLPAFHVLVFTVDDMEHVWCRQHQRFEHRHRHVQPVAIANNDSGFREEGSREEVEHQACPLQHIQNKDNLVSVSVAKVTPAGLPADSRPILQSKLVSSVPLLAEAPKHSPTETLC